MATTTAAQVLALIAPSLYARSDYGDYMALSVRQHASAATIGATYPELIAYHCAHTMTLALAEQTDYSAGRPSAPGQVTAMSSGDLSLSFGSTTSRGTVSPEDEEYLTTRYGRRYLAIRNALPITSARCITADPSVGLS